MIPADQCQHQTVQFNSGDYYITCRDCGAMWMRKGTDGRPEYGEGKDGPIGADPCSANIGPGRYLSGNPRATPPLSASEPAGAKTWRKMVEKDALANIEDWCKNCGYPVTLIAMENLAKLIADSIPSPDLLQRRKK